MSTTYKAQAIAHELADRLKNRKAISALTIVESFDTDQNPLIAIGTQASTDSAAFLIKVEPVSWPLAQDVLGNSAIAYTPHEIHVLKEASSTGTTSEMIAQIYAQVAEMGADFKLYESSHGGGVLVADIDTAAKQITESWPDLYHPLISAQ